MTQGWSRMERRQLLQGVMMGTGLAARIPAPSGVPSPAIFNVRDYRAAGDGKTLDSKAIQAAIDACAQSGGGAVYFPAGRFLSGTITLKDNYD
jgi:polygalacturonase